MLHSSAENKMDQLQDSQIKSSSFYGMNTHENSLSGSQENNIFNKAGDESHSQVKTQD